MRITRSKAAKDLPLLFKALSDQTRLRLLGLLSEGEVCVCHLGGVLKLAQPTVSRHLAYLKRAGLVTARRDGKWMHYTWAGQTEPVIRHLLDGLRDWMAKDDSFRREREALKRICC